MTVDAITPEQGRQADAALRKEIDEADNPGEVRVHEDHTRENRTPGFTRMRTDWHGPEKAQVDSLRGIVDGRIMTLFPDAFVVMADLFEIVREPVFNQATGEPILDPRGMVVWARNENGAFIEDYSRLGLREREDLLFRITSNLFEWQQTRADLWGDAMFAKAQWEEAFSDGFINTPGTRPTVDDKTNRARSHATDERYFAIFQTLMSKKADAVVQSMELLGQRLKDVLV